MIAKLSSVMSSQGIMIKLSMWPTDQDERHRILSHIWKLIEGKLQECYTEEVASNIYKFVTENCNGCAIDHPSQRQHDCLMMEVNALELLKYTCQDWRLLNCMKNKDILKCQTLAIVKQSSVLYEIKFLNNDTSHSLHVLFCKTHKNW